MHLTYADVFLHPLRPRGCSYLSVPGPARVRRRQKEPSLQACKSLGARSESKKQGTATRSRRAEYALIVPHSFLIHCTHRSLVPAEPHSHHNSRHGYYPRPREPFSFGPILWIVADCRKSIHAQQLGLKALAAQRRGRREVNLG